MTEWKIGDRAMVEIKSDGRGWVKLCCSGNPQQYTLVPTEVLHPLPAPDPLTDLERAVVDAALRWIKAVKAWEAPHSQNTTTQCHDALMDLKTQATALHALHDPVRELREAWVEYSQGGSATARARLERAIADMEAREKGKCP
jgi:hypothetical protein